MTSKGNSKPRRIKSARGSWFNSPYRTKSALLAPDQTIYAEFLILDFKWASAEALLVLLIFLLRVISFRSQGSEDSRRSHLYVSGKIVSRYINLNPEVCSGIKTKTNVFLNFKKLINNENWILSGAIWIIIRSATKNYNTKKKITNWLFHDYNPWTA